LIGKEFGKEITDYVSV